MFGFGRAIRLMTGLGALLMLVCQGTAQAQNPYAAKVNAAYGDGILPDENAAVLLAEAMGPRPEGTEMPDAWYELLGTVRPPESGQYFEVFGADLAPGDKRAALDNFSVAMSRPWKADDFPAVVKWLDRNRGPVELVREAVQRPEYFTPLVPPVAADGQTLGMIQTLLPHVQEMRSLGRYFLCQAYLHMENREWEAAWDNLHDCHRMGHLISRGPTLIDYLVGVAVSSMAINAEQQLLALANFNERQLQQIAKDLAALPAKGDPARAINLTERMMFMDTVDLVASGRTEDLETLGVEIGPGGPARRVLFALVDWSIVKQRGTSAYDRLRTVSDAHSGFARVDALKDSMHKGGSLHRGSLRTLVLEYLRQGSVRSVASAAVGDAFIDLLLPALANVEVARFRADQREQVLAVGVAVYRYQATNGTFPAELRQLTPQYLPTPPLDVFSGEPLTYARTDDGFLLYSVGENLKDDGGKTFGDRPGADDLRLQNPATFD